MRTTDEKQSWILVIGSSSHDYSAAIARGLDIKVAIEEERVSRKKYGYAHWYLEPARGSVDYCLDAVGISRGDLDVVVSSDLLPCSSRRLPTGAAMMSPVPASNARYRQ